MIARHRARIVIVNYNGADFVSKAIESALAQSVACEVVVVDNASLDESVEVVSARFPQVEIVRNRTNAGFGAGANIGAYNCEHPYLAFLNPDAVARPEWIERITTWMTEREIDVASSIVSAGEGESPFFAGGRWLPWLGAAVAARPARGGETDWVSGCALVARTSAFAQLGGFDPKYFLYFEDVDLSLRARQHDMRVATYPEPLVQHETHGRSTDQLGRRRKQCVGYAAKGRLIRRHVRGLAYLSALAFQMLVSPAVNRVALRDYPAVLQAFFKGALRGRTDYGK